MDKRYSYSQFRNLKQNRNYHPSDDEIAPTESQSYMTTYPKQIPYRKQTPVISKTKLGSYYRPEYTLSDVKDFVHSVKDISKSMSDQLTSFHTKRIKELELKLLTQEKLAMKDLKLRRQELERSCGIEHSPRSRQSSDSYFSDSDASGDCDKPMKRKSTVTNKTSRQCFQSPQNPLPESRSQCPRTPLQRIYGNIEVISVPKKLLNRTMIVRAIRKQNEVMYRGIKQAMKRSPYSREKQFADYKSHKEVIERRRRLARIQFNQPPKQDSKTNRRNYAMTAERPRQARGQDFSTDTDIDTTWISKYYY